tara:strand:- start:10230 stop:11252 length:1023 start_codon:yes stop_codon:yes gene_type:complete
VPLTNPLNLTKKKVMIVAEIGNNHEGNFKIAKKLIDEAKSCKVDAVKFQTFNKDLFYANNQKKSHKKLKKFNLSFYEFKKLSQYAKKKNLIFFSTPLDLLSAENLNSIQNLFKVASSDNNYFDLIKKIASFKKDIIISTGYADIKLIKKIESKILNTWRNKKKKLNLAFLHCVSSYPTKFNESNIFTIKNLKEKLSKKTIIGYSDHTVGIETSLLAVSLGARIIEKHFTLDKKFSSFRDHTLSSDPKEMKNLVVKIRHLEKMMKYNKKIPQFSEITTLKFNRRSCAISADLKAGEKIFEKDIIGVRPMLGIPINKKKIFINKKLKKNLKAGSILKLNHIK